MGSIHSSSVMRKSNVRSKLNFSTILLVFFGFLIGISFATVIFTKSFRVKHLKIEISQHYLFPTTRLSSSIHAGIITGDKSYRTMHDLISASLSDIKYSHALGSDGRSKIHVATNPRGAESLTPGIVVSETDFNLRRLWGDPNEDMKTRPKYLVAFAVGFAQRHNINAAIQKFSDEFTILLFHYDGLTSEWDHFEWSKRAIHVSARGQTKWWYAKRFLHPDIVAAYDYIFIWDEDLGVENFNAEDYLKMVKKHGLEISQPGIEVGPSEKLVQWNITRRRVNSEVHKEERDPQCIDPHLPPCAAFVEIMAPVFSRNAWRCVWHMIQNDLVHGWGLDFALRRCVQPAHEKIGVVDSQWVVHQAVPSLRNQGKAGKGKTRWQGVNKRCLSEWQEFETRLVNSDREYFSEVKG